MARTQASPTRSMVPSTPTASLCTTPGLVYLAKCRQQQQRRRRLRLFSELSRSCAARHRTSTWPLPLSKPRSNTIHSPCPTPDPWPSESQHLVQNRRIAWLVAGEYQEDWSPPTAEIASTQDVGAVSTPTHDIRRLAHINAPIPAQRLQEQPHPSNPPQNT